MNEPSGLISSSNSTTARAVLERPGCTLRHLSELLSDTSLRKMFETGCGGGDANQHATTIPPSSAASTVAPRGDPPESTAHHFADLYEQDRKLRSGSFGTVYTCHYKMDDPVVMYAVKVLDRRKLKVKDVSAVFREVKILGDLGKLMAEQEEQQDGAAGEQQRRYHIIKLVDFFVEPTYLYVVQEFAHGGDLFDKLTSLRSYTEWDAAIISRKLLETIEFLHGREIVHRDLKPENLLLRDANDKTSILVADFGFARYVPPQPDYCQTRCGTPSFVGPEILLGVPYGTSVDMWSVGCIIYMLISGYAPFQAPNHRGLFRKVRAGDFTFHEQTWKKVSLEAKQLISHLLTVNAKHRYTATQALQSKWFAKKPDQLKQNDLSSSLDGMKEFVPKNAWKRAVIALGFCSHAPFWNPDALTFSQQMNKWDHQELSKDGKHHKSSGHVMHKLSANRKFEDRYVLQKQLRKGSHATVWQCVHRYVNEKVCRQL
jgi:calcium/calmodulin-dependent protein kinase I